VNFNGVVFSASSWSKRSDLLTAYAGKKVQVGFWHSANPSYSCSGSSTGWYIDHLRISKIPPEICWCDIKKDGKCNILDYQLFIQDWGKTNCGTPPGSGNPPNNCECDLRTDGKCNILDYQIFIEDWGKTNWCPN
jgi:hypothetical protein